MRQRGRLLRLSNYDRIAILQRESMQTDRKGQDKIEPCCFKPETYTYLNQPIIQKRGRNTMADMNKLLGQLLGSGVAGGLPVDWPADLPAIC